MNEFGAAGQDADRPALQPQNEASTSHHDATGSAIPEALVQEARSNLGTVFIANMQWWTTDADVEALCARHGRVSDIKFKEDRATGRSLGVVEVTFAEPEAAAAFKQAADG
jgi:cleavage and polyadenylation specificity factor subunit 6/7